MSHVDQAVRYALGRHGDGLGVPELAELLEEPRRDVKAALGRLLAAGVVEQAAGGRSSGFGGTFHLVPDRRTR